VWIFIKQDFWQGFSSYFFAGDFGVWEQTTAGIAGMGSFILATKGKKNPTTNAVGFLSKSVSGY